MNSGIIIYQTQDGNTKVDVKSVEGFELLTNLEEVNYVSMCSPKLMEVFEESEIEVS